MIKKHHLRAMFFWRWWNFCRFLSKGVRLHPSVVLSGVLNKFRFSKRVKIGARVRISLSSHGEVVLGEGVWLSHDVELETASKVTIGAETTVQRRASINGSVTIGQTCIIAPNVFISSGTHPFREYPEKTMREQEKIIIKNHGSLSCLDRPIYIGSDCWLGVNSVICPGVTIGDGCVVGANSVVVSDVPDYSVVAGVPAKIIGSRF